MPLVTWIAGAFVTDKKDLEPTLAVLAEYGPPGYLHTLPHTHVPVADPWAVCLWSAARARSTLG